MNAKITALTNMNKSVGTLSLVTERSFTEAKRLLAKRRGAAR